MQLFIVGVTVRSRADYKNLKVAVSVESITDVSGTLVVLRMPLKPLFFHYSAN